MKTTTSFTMFVLLALASSTLATTSTDNRILQNVSAVTWDAENLGEILGAVWKFSILVCLVLMIVDAVQRFGGKKLGVMHSVRFIWFIYGTASVYTIGQGLYRGFNDLIFSKFSEEIFDGYFGSEQMSLFNNPITVGGVEGDTEADRTLIQNALFFELIIFIGLRIANLATSSGIKQGNPMSHLLGALRRVVGLFLALFNGATALTWYQVMHSYGQQDTVDNRAHFNVWLSWLLAFYVHAEALWSVIEVALHAADSIGSNKMKTYSEAANPNAGSTVQQQYDSIIDEVAFMHQDKKLAIASPVSQFYNVAWLARWIITIFLAITWFNKPRTMYWIILIIELGIIVLTVLSMASFDKPSGVLILVSEILTFLRHLVQLFNFMDQAGSGTMSQFLVDLFTHIAFWGYIIATLIEFALLFAPLYSTGGATAQENAASEDVRLDLESNNELGNKINTYKNMKSGKVGAPQQGQNAPGQPPMNNNGGAIQ
jgi:hypothetical protein